MPVTIVQAVLGTAALLVLPSSIAAGLTPNREDFAQATTVEFAATRISYPMPGEFLADGKSTAAPTSNVEVPAFRIMKRQVSLADYNRCVAASQCQRADAGATTVDVPVTGVNWLDAEAYARWFSQVTGETWRLPTAEEAAVAAAERFGGEQLSQVADDPANPASRWLRIYREEAAAKRPADPAPKAAGHYGVNSAGIEDFGGNVWEWTSTCYSRTSLSDRGTLQGTIENCGVHVLEGRHRAYMSVFVRDGKSGGCAVGTPPENLGFRLVQEKANCGWGCRIGTLLGGGARS